LHLSKNGSVDVLFPTGKNKKRQEIYNYSKQSVNDATFLLYVNANSELKWDGLKSLKGLKIAVIRGYNFGDEWGNIKGIQKIPINGIVQGFKMLEANRVDGFIGYEHNWDYVLKQKNIKQKFKKLPSFGSSSEYLVTLKSNPNGKQILKTFDEGKQILIKTGKLEEIRIKWFGK
ncbi:MAG: transporter substrate-binding domain-containing protein, partial [Campylobacteraceae bacterium]|nr:transporter substrate-binding domain-containing protein [Campylobacteraceae bacterium]